MQMVWSLKLLTLVWDGVRKSFSWDGECFSSGRKNKNQGFGWGVGGEKKSNNVELYVICLYQRKRGLKLRCLRAQRDEGTN